MRRDMKGLFKSLSSADESFSNCGWCCGRSKW
jgi:hypothetical protein